MKRVSEVLDEAARIVEGGWCQGTMRRLHEGQNYFCAEGAIHFASPEFDLETRAMKFLRDVIGNEYVHHWNDHGARTQAEVVSALEQAAEHARLSGV
jgi:hypothetical protein